MKTFKDFLNEISDKTLKSYHAKADKSADALIDKGDNKKANKRIEGQRRAVSRFYRTGDKKSYGAKSNPNWKPKDKDLDGGDI